MPTPAQCAIRTRPWSSFTGCISRTTVIVATSAPRRSSTAFIPSCAPAHPGWIPHPEQWVEVHHVAGRYSTGVIKITPGRRSSFTAS